MMTFINTRSEGLVILPTHRVAANRARFLLARSAPPSRAVVRHGSFRVRRRCAKRSGAFSFLARLKSSAARRAFGAYPAAREGQARSICSRFVPARTSRSSCRMFLRSSASWMLCCSMKEFSSRRSGITPQSVTKEANLTYEREAAKRARCG